MMYLKGLVSCLLISSCFAHDHGTRSIPEDGSLQGDEIAKIYARKLLHQFSGRKTATIKNFEQLLAEIESKISGTSNVCIDGLRLLKDVEKRSDEKAENLTKSFLVDDEHLVAVCPTLFYHIAGHKSVTEEYACESVADIQTKVESRASVWFYSTIALIGISLCGLMGVVVIPIVDKNYYFYVLQFFMALAVGTLTGDALLHLLPHSMRPASNNMEPKELLRMMMQRGIATILGILIFSLFEKFLKIVTGLKDRKKSKPDDDDRPKHNSHQHGHSHGINDSGSDSLSSIVWMVILGDGLHNFTDGMAIGAAFSNNIAGGFSTSVAVFCHELPHEMGDFAVLLKAGMSARKAIYYNILSSVLGFLGMCVGITIGDSPETTQWVFAATAGLFVYIALVDMVRKLTFFNKKFGTKHYYFQLPELLAPKSVEEGFQISQFILQLCGMLSGFATMWLIAIYEHDLERIFTN